MNLYPLEIFIKTLHKLNKKKNLIKKLEDKSRGKRKEKDIYEMINKKITLRIIQAQ